MTKSKLGRPHHNRWNPEEWTKVAVMALGLLERGETRQDALEGAQRAVLPKHRWHTPDEVRKFTRGSAGSASWAKYHAIAMGLSAAQREAILLKQVDSPASPKPEPAPEPEAAAPVKASKKPQGPSNGLVRWTRREWAEIARAAKWVSERNPNEKLWRQVDMAQQWAMPEDRRRGVAGLQHSFYKGELAKLLAEGLTREWEIKHLPFNPPGTEPPAPPPATAQEAAKTVANAQSAAALQAAIEPQATQAPPMQRSTLAEASAAFGAAMMRELDKLLRVHAQVMLDQVTGQIAANAQETAAQVASVMETSMRRTVHAIVEAELGGPVSPPAVPADEPAAQAEPSFTIADTPPRQRLRVDVVGFLEAPVLAKVRETFARARDVDLKFFSGDHSDHRYAPDPTRHTIVLPKRMTHGLSDKIKKFKVKPIYVEPTAALITNAIEELQRSAMQ